MAFTDIGDAVTGAVATAAWGDAVRENFLLAGPHLIARKTADESVTSSTALQDDNHLFFTIGANEAWWLQYQILAVGSSAGDYKAGFSVPSGCVTYRNFLWLNGGTLAQYSGADAVGGADILVAPLDAIDGDGDYMKFDIHAVNGGTAGTFMLRWAQNASNATPSTFRTNSTLWGVRLA